MFYLMNSLIVPKLIINVSGLNKESNVKLISRINEAAKYNKPNVSSNNITVVTIGFNKYKIPNVGYRSIPKIFKGKMGVYCLYNTQNGDLYVGSSNNLHRRANEYYKPSMLKKYMKIYSQLSKYGHAKFVFIPLAFYNIVDIDSDINICSNNCICFESGSNVPTYLSFRNSNTLSNNRLTKLELIALEQYYIDRLQPTNNFSKSANYLAGSSCS